MGKGFIKRYAVLADGEKDPRNLLVAFAIARVILIEFDITETIEVCLGVPIGQMRRHSSRPFAGYVQRHVLYFPITFRPPPDDPYGITAEDLKKALWSVTPRL